MPVCYIFLVEGQVIGHLKIDNRDGQALNKAQNQRALLYPNAAIAVFVHNELPEKIEANIAERV